MNGFGIEVSAPGDYPAEAATLLREALPKTRGTVVITGGTTAERVYGALAREPGDWSHIDVLFSDERCVPPDDPASNYGLARRLLLDGARPATVHRMKGEDDPDTAAAAYHRQIAPAVDAGIDLVVLGLGSDCHICAMFPGSPALDEATRLCVAVGRPDGMTGLTLTPPAVVAGNEHLVIATGRDKAEAVRRAVRGDEPARACPARLLAGARDVTFVLDEEAASLL